MRRLYASCRPPHTSTFGRILRDPEVVAQFLRIVPTFDVSPSASEELAAFLHAQHEFMGPLIRRLGIRIE